MTFLRRLESLNIPVEAAATASAPVDGAVTINRWVNNYQPIDAVYLPACVTNFIFSKDQYDFPGTAARAIKPAFYQTAKDLFEFKIDWPTYRAKTKNKVQEVLNPDFMAIGNIAKLAEEFHQVLGGGNTKAISAGPKADHRATYIYSVIHAKPWFDSFMK